MILLGLVEKGNKRANFESASSTCHKFYPTLHRSSRFRSLVTDETFQ